MPTQVLSRAQSSVHETITKKIIDAIEAGVGKARMPWHSPGRPIGIPINATTYAHYRGVNILLLWMAAMAKSYPTGEWASYKQWQERDAQVRKGEQGTLIIFYKQIEVTPLEDADPEYHAEYRYFAKASWVFNAAQIDGYEPVDADELLGKFDKHEAAEGFVGLSGAKVEHGFAQACYRRDRDLIEMPQPEWFMDSCTSTAAESYYAVLLHELTHWTGAEHRLNREFGNRFGDYAYAMEELVAELGSAFLSAELGISSELRDDHAMYIGSWLEVLRKDNRAIFTAASMAQEAFAYLTAKAEKNERVAASTP